MKSANNILIFASKKGGEELTEYLLSISAPIELVVIANQNDVSLIQLVQGAGIPHCIYGPETQQTLADSSATYGWILNLWSPHILKPPVLALAHQRLNVHPSMAPYCRGNDNAAWTLRENVPAGVSLMEMGKNIDDGDIYIQKEVPYSFPIRGKELNRILFRAANELFRENWPAIHSGKMVPFPQNGPATYHTRRETEQDRIREFSHATSTGECLQWILAHDFSPGTTAELHHDGKKYKVTVSFEEL